MGLLIGNGVSLYAANDAEDAPHRPNAYVTDVSRDDSVAPERRNCDPRPANRNPRTVNRERERQPSTRDPRLSTR